MANGNGRAVKLTPTEQRMYDLLADGLPHTRKELHACLGDELGPLSNIKPHLTSLRKKILDHEEIVCVFVHRRICYRLFTLDLSRTKSTAGVV